MSEDPTNKELLHFIMDIKDKVGNIKEKDLPEINERVKVTNGSVAEIIRWRERMTGAMWALGITFTFVIIPLMTWAFITISKIPDRIDKGISQALQNNISKINEAD